MITIKAINYILKPISMEKFFFTFDDILERINAEKKDNAIIVKLREGIQRILISNFLFV